MSVLLTAGFSFMYRKAESGKLKTPLIALCALEPASARCATCK